MIYLGIHNSYQAGAALIIDGQVIGAVTEERFNRVKNYHGWPTESISYLLDLARISLSDVDKVVYGMVTETYPDAKSSKKLIERMLEDEPGNDYIKARYTDRILSESRWNQKHLEELFTWSANNNLDEKISFVDHHVSHAAGAFFTSPFDKAVVFTCDGKGNYKSSSVSIGAGSELKEIEFQTTYDSVGYYYGIITKALGYKSERHEGKVTGLAALGDPGKFTHITDKMLEFKDGKIRTNIGKFFIPWFASEEDLPFLYNEVKKHKKEDVAAAAQDTLERVIVKWIDFNLRKLGKEKKRVCLSGGVFANVKLNQKIRELDIVDDVYVQPAMGDMGIPLGSCLMQMSLEGNTSFDFVDSMDLGPAFRIEEILKEAETGKVTCKKVPDIREAVAQLLDSDKVIGFCHGRMEYGPRALCNRSIIFHARDKSVNDWLNKRLNRTEFMPFAPVTTLEIAGKCFEGWNEDQVSADFMTMTYNVTDDFAEKCPAAVHVDNTARPQVIREHINEKMHSIISHYNKTRGDLALVNTSFNNHEEPIVCNARDALDSLYRNNVDVLVVEDYVIEIVKS